MQKLIWVTVPGSLAFADLKLCRDPDGYVSFDRDVIDQICVANGIDPAAIWGTDEDNLSGLIVGWYARHRALGGDTDPVAEDLILETAAEDALGDGISHAPGRA